MGSDDDEPSVPRSTSQSRFHERIGKFRLLEIPVAYHHFWWLMHNCIAHPLIGVLPVGWTFAFHDYTSGRINTHGFRVDWSWLVTKNIARAAAQKAK